MSVLCLFGATAAVAAPSAQQTEPGAGTSDIETTSPSPTEEPTQTAEPQATPTEATTPTPAPSATETHIPATPTPTPTPSPTNVPIRINFQPKNVAAVCGYTQDNGDTYAARNSFTYGWNIDHRGGMRDRHALTDQLLDTLAHFESGGIWEIEVPNGTHDVKVTIGDTSHSSTHTINVEGVNYWNNLHLSRYQFRQSTKTVTVSDGKISIDQGSLGDGATHINYIEIDTAGSVPSCATPLPGATPTPTPSGTVSPSPSASVTPTPSTSASATPTPTPSPTVVMPEIKVNFQLQGSALVCGYTPDHGDTYAGRSGQTYGWNKSHTDTTRDRQMTSNQLLDTLAHFHSGGVWEVAVPNGAHKVTVGIGDPGYRSTHTLNVEGVNFWQATRLGASEFVQATKTVTVTDGRLTLDQGSAGEMYTRINYIQINPDNIPEVCATPTPTPTPSKTPTPKPTPSKTPTPTPTPTPSKTPTPTPSMTPTPSGTPTPPPVREKDYRINFQLSGSNRVCGFDPDFGKTFGARNGESYGWNFDHLDVMRDREIKNDQKLDTLAHFHGSGKWEVRVPNGLHRVTVSIGDGAFGSTHTLNVEGVSFWKATELEGDEFRQITRKIEVDDGRLTLDQGFALDKSTRINYITLNVDGPPKECDQTKAEPDPKPKPQPVEDKPRTSGGGGSIGPRPYGLSGLVRVFGAKCNDRTNNARTWFPSAGGRGKYGYVYYHSKLAKKVGRRVIGALHRKHKVGAVDYGVWGYSCRIKRGGTSYSVHSWGAAIDTNTLKNPWQATQWNGRGSNGRNYRRMYPRLWLRQNFYWGINFRDPMHFQYVAGY